MRERRELAQQAAPKSVFERGSLLPTWADQQSDRNSTEATAVRWMLEAGDPPPHRRRRRETFSLSHADAPTLTVTSDPYNQIAVVGCDRCDWAITYWAEAGGETESEADERLQRLAVRAIGSTVSLTSAGLADGHLPMGVLLIEGPANAPVIVHASYTSVTVHDLTAPVRVAATHARATVLGTTGQVDVTAGVIDFAGAGGRVTLSAETEINLKITGQVFEGRLLAWAQGAVRALVPRGFETPLEAIVTSEHDFVCRTEFVADVQRRRQGELLIFTRGVEPRRAGRNLHLRSENSTVVLDTL